MSSDDRKAFAIVRNAMLKFSMDVLLVHFFGSSHLIGPICGPSPLIGPFKAQTFPWR
jgi:hypothetical protein